MIVDLSQEDSLIVLFIDPGGHALEYWSVPLGYRTCEVGEHVQLRGTGDQCWTVAEIMHLPMPGKPVMVAFCQPATEAVARVLTSMKTSTARDEGSDEAQ